MESWYENKLVGGLYGISIGKLFGELMFLTMDNASKVAYITLVKVLDQEGFLRYIVRFIQIS